MVYHRLRGHNYPIIAYAMIYISEEAFLFIQNYTRREGYNPNPPSEQLDRYLSSPLVPHER